MAQLKPGPKPVKAQRRTALRPVLTVLSTGWRGKTSTHDGVVLGALRRGHGEVEARGEGRGVLAARDAHHGGVGADDVAGECSTATNTGGGAAAVVETNSCGGGDVGRPASIPLTEEDQGMRRTCWWSSIYPGILQSTAIRRRPWLSFELGERSTEREEAGEEWEQRGLVCVLSCSEGSEGALDTHEEQGGAARARPVRSLQGREEEDAELAKRSLEILKPSQIGPFFFCFELYRIS